MPQQQPHGEAEPPDHAPRLANAITTAVRAEIGSLAKSDFLAYLSHELRTPMNSVMGMLRLLLDSNLHVHQHDYATAAAKAAERLLELVREISSFPLHDARQLQLQPIPFPIATTCRTVVKLLAGQAAEKNLTMRCKIADDVPPHVCGDAEKLAQVMANLMHNAIRFTEQGAVRLEVSRATDDNLQFTVADTGRGISPAKQAVIFDFSHPLVADSPYADVSLELAVCREIINAMGGTISLDSTPDKGTTFTVTVPLPGAAMATTATDEPTAVPPPPSPRIKVCAGLRILVAEDDPINQSLAVAFIEKLGGQVEVADDGAAAVAKWRDGNYNLVFLDCDMPILDGFDAARAIREAETADGRRRLPIIAMTAYAMPGDRERCLAAGMDDHIPKPVTIDALQRVVRNHLLPDQTAAPPAPS